MTGRYQVPSASQPVVTDKGIITNPWWQWALSIGKNANDPIDWSNIVNTPTTLAGYGITDAYTITQIDAMFAALSGVYQPLDADLTAISALASTGLATRTGAGTWTLRAIAVGSGLGVSNSDGVSGNPTVLLGSVLAAYAGGDTPSTFTLGIVDSVDAAAWRTAIGAGTSSVVGANPTASVGLSAVNGSATTAMRSDGAPALSQSISPTWTGSHAFQGLTNFGLSSMFSVGVSAFGVPIMRWVNGGATTNMRAWESYALTTSWALAAVDDARSVFATALDFTRSASAVAAMAYGNSTDNPPHTFYGAMHYASSLQNFVNDAAAAAGGIAVNQLYRNGSVVQIRVS